MGVPAFFAWLSKKYPSIVIYAKEESSKVVGDVNVPIDLTKPNPNGFEFDNLYLDMNGIIHPCTHPENKPAPKNEAEMFIAIFEYMDRLMGIIRPRRLLYLAIDGVAPRAKMNQQRSRRFRAAKESEEKTEAIEKIRNELENRGAVLPEKKKDHFDSNCITPGTPFMHRLSLALRYYIYKRLNDNPGWKDLQVILSDASVPGEGEHKIMNFIRRQRASPSHDPNTKHCLCGADADLIMLGLATHEVNFTIIREEFKPNTPRPCEVCGQYGHEMVDCVGGEAKEDSTLVSSAEADFIFINLSILRQYLEIDLKMTSIPFEWDFERALDDWVFMCFFVGNDFLPHLPSLEIREGAIDKLIAIYSMSIKESAGWLTDSGTVNFDYVLKIIKNLGEMEDDIFKNRRNSEIDFRNRRKSNNNRFGRNQNQRPEQNQSHTSYRPRDVQAVNTNVQKVERNLNNMEAANNLKHILKPVDGGSPNKKPRMNGPGSGGDARNESTENLDEFQVQDMMDDVKLWEDGFRSRYYQNKFGVDIKSNHDFPQKVALEYARGLCWVLAYYYQGCASWNWYYPYHYAPFASDFQTIDKMEFDFKEKTQPFKPLQQLMSVFPAASRSHVPPAWQDLMTDPQSPIIDFYPTDFKIDLNGKRHAWMGVALLPFVEEKRLLKALNARLDRLEPDEVQRNNRGAELYFVHKDHKVSELIKTCYDDFGQVSFTADEDYEEYPESSKVIQPEMTGGIAGIIWTEKKGTIYLPGDDVPSAIPELCKDIPGIEQDVIGCAFYDPVYERNFIFPATILDKAKLAKPVNLLPPVRGRGGQVGMRGSNRGNNRGNNNGNNYHQRGGYGHGGDSGNRMGHHHDGRRGGYGNNWRNDNYREGNGGGYGDVPQHYSGNKRHYDNSQNYGSYDNNPYNNPRGRGGYNNRGNRGRYY